MAAKVDNPIFQSGTVLGNRYQLDEPLASGGMAEVWKGHDTILKRSVAVKLLHPHLANDDVVVERFRREAIAAAGLGHPNIVPTFDTGAEGKNAFIVMGLVLGPTLGDIIASQGKLPVPQVANLARQIAGALDHAHSRGIVHRDIKPANVLMVDGSRVMVSDFGIAKAIEEVTEMDLTMPGLVVATPGYSAPEQLSGQPTDQRTDVYALGVLIHEMACGHAISDTPTTQLEALVDDEDGHSCPELPVELAPIVAKATATEPDHRFQSAAALGDELASVERGSLNAKTSPPPSQASPKADSPKPPTKNPPTVVMPARPQPKLGRDRTTSGHPRRQAVTAVIVVVLLIAAASLGRYIAGLGETGPRPPAAAPAPVSTEARSFDPFGDGAEHESDASRAVDGDLATAWTTETYASRTIDIKPGVGLALQIGSSEALSSMGVEGRSTGWSAEIYVANDMHATFDGWGEPVDVQSGLGTSAKFDLHGKTGDSILLWITDLGTDRRFTASEVRINRT